MDYQTDVIERLVRMETKIDFIGGRIDRHEERITVLEKSTINPDHETRLRKLERALWIAVGAAGTVGGVIGNVITQFTGV